MKVLATAMGTQAVPFVSLWAEDPGCEYCVQGCGVEPESRAGLREERWGRALV